MTWAHGEISKNIKNKLWELKIQENIETTSVGKKFAKKNLLDFFKCILITEAFTIICACQIIFIYFS